MGKLTLIQRQQAVELFEQGYGYVLVSRMLKLNQSQVELLSRMWRIHGKLCLEAYSAAGKTWFGWWLVEHYFSYHVDCPDGCDSGEPARGRKDPPYFQMSYGSFDHIPDLVDPFVESLLPA